jgi:hypothetical protein
VVHARAQELNARLSISNDVYNRTTSAVHRECCQLMFRKSMAAGDIYLGSYEGWRVPTTRGCRQRVASWRRRLRLTRRRQRLAGTTCARKHS